MNTPVSFPIAKSIIQKGFEVQVRPMYYRTYKIDSGSYMYNTDGVLELCTMPLVCLKSKWIDAPIISEVVMWLYEKYEIWIVCTPFYIAEGRRFSADIFSADNKKTSISHYKTPTEAYSAAIEYALKKSI